MRPVWIAELWKLQNDLTLKYGKQYLIKPCVGTIGIDLHNFDGLYLKTFYDEAELRYSLLS